MNRYDKCAGILPESRITQLILSETTVTVIETQPKPAYTHPAPANQATVPEAWTLIIRPQRKLFDLRLGELWQACDLVQLFVGREVVAGYKQTILGPLWCY